MAEVNPREASGVFAMSDFWTTLERVGGLEDLATVGFCRLPLLTESQVGVLIRESATTGVAPDDACLYLSNSSISSSESYRRSAAGLAKLALDMADHDVEVVDEWYAVSWPGQWSGSGLQVASDGARVRPHLAVEIAIDVASEVAGEIWVVPKSHRWNLDRHEDVITSSAAELIARNYAQPVHLGPGEALLCDPRLLRFALPNRIDRPRRALRCNIPLPSHRAELLDRSQALGGESPRTRLDSTLVTELLESDLLVESGITPWQSPNATETRCRSCGSPTGQSAPDPWKFVAPQQCGRCRSTAFSELPAPGVRPRTVAVRTEPLPYSHAPILSDERLDRQLRSQGFVIVETPVISELEAETLRTKFGELHDWKGEGHLNDFNQRDLAYRSRAADLIRDHLLASVQPLFADHDPFLYTFLCKWPGVDNSLEPHRDWMYVDERAGERTFLAFVALDPIEAERGRIQVLPGSHRIDSMMRGTDLRPEWLSHHDVLEQRLVSYSLQVGRVAIWDSALVHSSLPNNSPDPRIAAGLWFSRRGVPLVHVGRSGHDTATMWNIDRDFYRTQNPYRLMVANPPYPVADEVPVQERALDAAELDIELDRVQGIVRQPNSDRAPGWFDRLRQRGRLSSSSSR